MPASSISNVHFEGLAGAEDAAPVHRGAVKGRGGFRAGGGTAHAVACRLHACLPAVSPWRRAARWSPIAQLQVGKCHSLHHLLETKIVFAIKARTLGLHLGSLCALLLKEHEGNKLASCAQACLSSILLGSCMDDFRKNT